MAFTESALCYRCAIYSGFDPHPDTNRGSANHAVMHSDDVAPSVPSRLGGDNSRDVAQYRLLL